ncbi:hypothetical protein BM536_000690 [Streptomyces phaeoluteigriseus]|uniref:Plasmid pRiA4b Orf3-like domain-containing protein n=1 Tax=Streptomyces phaeoluteigriseus TaxID=114686 RepID=A0A1V6MZE4_9ACTN|nr:hypothetical protein BM536_000690 [Streptomyces phaeoluteigriseus]
MISYTYDFGDDWVHHIEVDKVLSAPSATTYPRCLTYPSSLPARGLRRPLGLRGLPRRDHRPPARAVRRTPALDRRHLRSRPPRHRRHQQAPHRPRAIGGTGAVQQLGYGV